MPNHVEKSRPIATDPTQAIQPQMTYLPIQDAQQPGLI